MFIIQDGVPPPSPLYYLYSSKEVCIGQVKNYPSKKGRLILKMNIGILSFRVKCFSLKDVLAFSENLRNISLFSIPLI